ncbi:GNAT family N-acetyltransferase [Tamlana sp. 2_MG-2023]|uniref:GNAT family N-acetyltransferase n=1 Tax=unclassified Tamlana TaxID=2614803 RepID=UPI0026E424C9|nr:MULTISPECIES: GNAT family N-acetyltransferase [unclassified Tamlana]MDO6759664.1 GNAT family N-acetyltransferase [Tamlana sp. 2_MG-2023]MDO6791287.1 GNAT family N-acetyltransferase [Tamlana sp. 1_MG-2023]
MKTYKIYDSSEALPESWDALASHDIFLQKKYLFALKQGAPDNIQLYYVGVFLEDILIGVAVVQHVKLYLEDMFRKSEVSCVKEVFQKMISKVLKGNVLVVGNLTHTGQHGMFFNEKMISYASYSDLVMEALNALKTRIKVNHKKTVRLMIFKDFFTDDVLYNQASVFQKHKLHQVSVQPNMIFKVPSEWQTITNYTSELTKKYRDRYKRAKKKLGKITCVELDLSAVESHNKTLHKLYLNVSNNAKFNSFRLPENHFLSLKQHLQDHFKIFGYFLDEELVGFYTLILNGKQLETYFLGYDSEHQYPNQLYLNMLYDMLEFGIENRFTQIVYARTAMTIKSSVGAIGLPMQMYMKHTNPSLNSLLKPVFKLMNPKQEWEERHPFKVV